MGKGQECLSDAELLFAFRKGNLQALDRLIGRYQASLHGYLKAMTGSQADADDLFQETWMRVVRNPHSFRYGAFNAWLWSIARNLLTDRIRGRKPVTSLQEAAANGTTLGDLLPSSAPQPQEEVDADDLGRHIQEAVNRLPPEQKDVFLLRTQAGLPFARIAKMRRISINTALGRMHYALQRLRKDLGPVYEAFCGDTTERANHESA